jgi:hypothetical protein
VQRLRPRATIAAGSAALLVAASSACLDFSRFGTCYASETSACTDAAVSDSGAGDEGRGDAGSAALGPFCSSLDPAPRFCDAFDVGALGKEWSKLTQGSGATLLVDGDVGARSPPGVIVRIPAVSADPAPSAYLTRSFTETTRTAHLAFAIWPDDVTGKTSGAPAAVLQVSRGNETSELQLVLASRPYVKEIGFDADGQVSFGRDHALSVPLSTGRWTRVEIELVLEGAPRASARFDGETTFDTFLTGTWTPGPLAALVGVVFAEPPTAALTVRYDDVTVDVR